MTSKHATAASGRSARIDAVEAPLPDQHDPQREHGDTGQAGHECRRGVRRGTDVRQPVVRAVEVVAEREHPLPVGGGAVEGDEVGEACDLIDDVGVELAAGAIVTPRPGLATTTRARGRNVPVTARIPTKTMPRTGAKAPRSRPPRTATNTATSGGTMTRT